MSWFGYCCAEATNGVNQKIAVSEAAGAIERNHIRECGMLLSSH
jgi:hypothetical protein